MLVVILLLVVGGAFYQVDETELVIITQFGEPVGDAITTPGLKMKAPFIHRVRRFEKRILEWDGSPDEIPTLDKRFIKLDTTARWRIVDPLQFLKAVKTERSAQSRLDDLIDSAARDVVSSHLLIESVRNFTRELPVDEVEASERRMGEDLPADTGAAADAPRRRRFARRRPAAGRRLGTRNAGTASRGTGERAGAFGARPPDATHDRTRPGEPAEFRHRAHRRAYQEHQLRTGGGTAGV